MLKTLFAAALAAATLLATTSVMAYPPAPSPQHYRCTPDGKPATPGDGWCVATSGPTQQQQQNGTPAQVRPLSPSEVENLKQVIKDEMRQQRPVAVAPRGSAGAATAGATQQQQQSVKIIIEDHRARVEEPKAPPTATPAEPPKAPAAPKTSGSTVPPVAPEGKVFKF